MFRNEHLDAGTWVDNIIWDESCASKCPEFHMDDPTLVILQEEVDEIKSNVILIGRSRSRKIKRSIIQKTCTNYVIKGWKSTRSVQHI
jgi:hypothetical protein